jgi:hypothetical protein
MPTGDITVKCGEAKGTTLLKCWGAKGGCVRLNGRSVSGAKYISNNFNILASLRVDLRICLALNIMAKSGPPQLGYIAKTD